MKRRQFIGASAALAASLTQPDWLFALDPNNRYRKAIGLQLYTLRNPIGEDVEGTLKAVAEAGYQQVEPYGFPNADAMIQAAKDNGMAVHSSHINTDGILFPERRGVQPIEELIEKAKDVGLTHLVIPWLPNNLRDSLDKYKSLAEKCNVAAEKTKAAGIQLSYHNHAFEFQPMESGRCGYDILMDEFSESMQFEIDTFWVKVGGHDPSELIRRLKGRVTQLHLKDLDASVKIPTYDGIPPEAFKELGNGVIDVEPLLAAAEDAGVSHCHVEQDHSPNPLGSVRQSMKHLKSL